ncbi:MAG: hypothetical protein HC930_10110 [Hydrococcus sp. SU_1_0]|nr:hypothetical protein [Hydrococcus sp. SU_1_0]
MLFRKRQFNGQLGIRVWKQLSGAKIMDYLSVGQLHLLSTAPMNHEAQLWGKKWTKPVPYSADTTGIDSDDKDDKSDGVSESFKRIVPSENSVKVPSDAKAVLVHLKAKAYIPNGKDSGTMNYCQIDATLQKGDGSSTQNHAIHVEEWGGGCDYQQERRRIAYTTNVIPLDSDGGFVISVCKGIWGRSEVEIGVTLVGYFM